MKLNWNFLGAGGGGGAKQQTFYDGDVNHFSALTNKFSKTICDTFDHLQIPCNI